MAVDILHKAGSEVVDMVSKELEDNLVVHTPVVSMDLLSVDINSLNKVVVVY